jgi:hypothetical protein
MLRQSRGLDTKLLSKDWRYTHVLAVMALFLPSIWQYDSAFIEHTFLYQVLLS